MTTPTSGAPSAQSFNAGPLVDPVDRHAAREFARRTRAAMGSSASHVVGIVVFIIAVLFFGGALVMILVTTSAGAVSVIASGAPFGVLFALVPLAFVAILVTMILLVGTRFFRSRSEHKWYRLDRFARANGMTFVPRQNTPALPGMIFGIGHSRHSLDLVRGERPRFVEFANYRYTTGSGKNSTTHRWGYVAVKLDVPLPHIVLDALGNNRLFGSNLPIAFDRDQRLSLEGDFDRYFALHCPQGYEQDALYLFTPDIMARFIDNAAEMDVEIVDNWLFLYARRDFSTLDPATWAWLFSVVGALLDKFAQWSRWRDDRLRAEASARAASVTRTSGGLPLENPAGSGHDSAPFATPLEALRPPPGVAQGGRRLRKRVPWAAFVIGAVFVVFWITSQTGLLGLIFDR